MPAFLARRYDEPIDVERRDDVPSSFVRRGRRYAVQVVLAHWWETGAWWQAADLTAGLADDEREMWRVEASRGRGHGSGVYDLCLDWTAGGWTLVRAQD